MNNKIKKGKLCTQNTTLEIFLRKKLLCFSFFSHCAKKKEYSTTVYNLTFMYIYINAYIVVFVFF